MRWLVTLGALTPGGYLIYRLADGLALQDYNSEQSKTAGMMLAGALVYCGIIAVLYLQAVADDKQRSCDCDCDDDDDDDEDDSPKQPKPQAPETVAAQRIIDGAYARREPAPAAVQADANEAARQRYQAAVADFLAED